MCEREREREGGGGGGRERGGREGNRERGGENGGTTDAVVNSEATQKPRTAPITHIQYSGSVTPNRTANSDAAGGVVSRHDVIDFTNAKTSGRIDCAFLSCKLRPTMSLSAETPIVPSPATNATRRLLPVTVVGDTAATAQRTRRRVIERCRAATTGTLTQRRRR